MSRKTIAVAAIIRTANDSLAHIVEEPYEEAPDIGVARRWGIIGMVESVLFATDNYRGYGYLASEFAAEGEPTARPGTVLREGYDETRRRYFA